MYQSYLYFKANTCLQEMSTGEGVLFRTTHTKINSVWLRVSDNEHSVSKFPYVWFK